jgi:outer membrane autotransporter protein
MIRKEMGFRITKIGKTAVSVAIGSLMATVTPLVFAADYNISSSSTLSIASDTNSLRLYYGGTPANPAISLNLNAGISILGQTTVGTTPWSIFTYKDINTQWLYLNNTTLTLNGNNQITGVVGRGYDWDISNNSLISEAINPLANINILNSGNIFNNQIYSSNVNLNSGSTVQFLGNLGDVNNSTTLNYLGSNSTVTLGTGVTLFGNVTNTAISNSNLIFNGSGTITGSVGSSTTAIGTVQVNGNSALVSIGGDLSTDRLDYQAASVVAVGNDLFLNVNTASNASNSVAFNNTSGVLQIGGDVVGLSGKAAVTTTLANTGTVTMVSGTQSITGDIGTQALSIGTLNIGGANSGTGLDTSSNVSSTTTANGNLFAQTIRLNNATSTSSELIMSAGRNITGAVKTETNDMGKLTLLGGTQTVTGTVGELNARLDQVTSGATNANATFTGVVYAQNVINSGTGTSNFSSDVNATNIGVGAGTSNFASNVTATTTTVGTGTGNFNTSGGITTSNIVFSGTGKANLNQGLTGAIDFDGRSATVNLADGENISGAITGDASAPGVTAGTVNALGGGSLGAAVGKLSALNINRATDTATTDTTNTSAKTLTANASVDAGSIKLFNDGTLQMANGANLTGAVSTTTNNTGILTLIGNSGVTGTVGQAGTALKQINAGANGSTVSFNNGVVYATTLNYTGNGTVVLNSATTPTLGLIGNVDFVTDTGTLTLGDNVNLVTENATNPAANTQTSFQDANGATLRFAGTSTVTGDLGSAANTNNQNFKTVYAGAAGETVTFNGKVYVASNTLHAGAGIVNLNDNLYGPLVYDANGTVNVADGKTISPSVDSSAAGYVQTVTPNTGTLNFLGATDTQVDIGTGSAQLNAVNFNSANTGVTVNIGNHVYATTTTIGNGANTTTANITASGKFLGNNLTLTAGTTLNSAGAVVNNTAISLVDFAHTKVVDGSLINAGTVTKSTTGTGVITVNDGATLNFAVGTSPWAANAGGSINTAASSSIIGASGSTLVFNPSGTGSNVNVSLLGSLKGGQIYSLIDVAGTGANNVIPTNLKDNSFVIDTALSRTGGDLVLTSSRANNQYIAKSGTAGDISNAAAERLGTLAAAGTAYTQDIQTVLNKLDIDQWGFGNNASNLATQAKRLAPIANNSLNLGALQSSTIVGDSLGMRMHQLRIPETAKPYDAKGAWVRTINGQATQKATAAYDGYKSAVTGLALGLDTYPNRDALVGAAFTYSTNKISQQDFRLGDEATIQGTHLSLYGAYNLTPELFADATATASWFSSKGNRNAVVGRNAKFDFESKAASGKVNVGYRFKLGESASYLTPLMSYQHTRLDQPGYTETEAGDIGLVVAGQKRLTHKQTAIGLRLEGTYMAAGMVVKPDFSIMSTKTGGDYSRASTAQFAGDLTNTTFSTPVYRDSKNSGVKLSLGLGLLMNKTTSMSVRYDMSQSGSNAGSDGYGLKSRTLDLAVRWNF